MTIKPVLCAALLAASSVLAQEYPATTLPAGVPHTIDVDKSSKRMPLVFMIVAKLYYQCLALYATAEESDPWDAHAFVLEKWSVTSGWQQVAYIETSLTPDKATALFWVNPSGNGLCVYRVKDCGSIY